MADDGTKRTTVFLVHKGIYKTINLIWREYTDNNIRIYSPSIDPALGSSKIVLNGIPVRKIDNIPEDINLTKADDFISEITLDEELIKIETDPIYRKHFFNLLNIKSDQPEKIESKNELIERIYKSPRENRKNKFVIKSLKTYIPSSATQLIELAEILKINVFARLIKGIKISAYYNAHLKDLFFVMKYKDGFVILNNTADNFKSKIFNCEISKFEPFALRYFTNLSNKIGAQFAARNAYIRMDMIINTSGIYFVNLENGIDNFWSIRDIMNRDENNKDDLLFLSKIFITDNRTILVIPDKENYFNKIFIDNNFIFYDYIYLENYFYAPTKYTEYIISKIDILDKAFSPEVYIKQFHYDYRWLKGQGFLKKDLTLL